MPTISPPSKPTPLAARLRPSKLDEVIGQTHLVGPGMPIRRMADKKRAQSTIIWGPPGTGKTTLVRALSREVDALFFAVNATNATVKELREIIAEAQRTNTQPLVFVDECLPYNALVAVMVNGSPKLMPIGYLVENRLKCQILSVDIKTNRSEWTDIISWSYVDPKPMVEVTIENGIVLRCSSDHLVYTTNRGYVSAGELGLEDDVCLLQNYLQEAHDGTRTQDL